MSEIPKTWWLLFIFGMVSYWAQQHHNQAEARSCEAIVSGMAADLRAIERRTQALEDRAEAVAKMEAEKAEAIAKKNSTHPDP